MATTKETVFSEYEVYRMGVIFGSVTDGAEPENYQVPCIGSSEEELEVRTVTKKCRGTVSKERTQGTGAGTLKVSLHCPVELFRRLYGMTTEGLADGVWAYGKNCLHPVVCITQHVKDEDGNIKYKAYPKATIKSGMARKTENGADEVAEIELEISIMPDDTDNGMYESLKDDLTDEGIIEKWMTAFTPDLVKKKTA